MKSLLERSQAFAEHLLVMLAHVEAWDESPPCAACAASCQLSIEHSQAVCVLFASGLPNAACVSLRAQYEAVLRAAWLLYCANKVEVNRLLQPLNLETEKDANKMPGARDMLDALQARLRVEPGLKGLVVPLVEAHAVLWKSLNSFAHAGIHALHRVEHGFPELLVMDVVRNSNVLTHFAARLMVRTGGTGEQGHAVDRAWMGFEDCLPSVRPM